MVLKSNFDPRKYRVMTTSRGLDVLLVEDPACTKCAVAVTIHSGHFQDPKDCQGLSHLLEHCLFLGSEGYPSANALHDYLNAFSGQANAWTASEFTSVHFEADESVLAEGLLRLSDMLARPLFDPAAVEREISAIDAEFKAKQKDDLRRLYQVHKETCNPSHPFSKFTVGNAQTLGSFAVDELIGKLSELHHRQYTSGNMRVCVIGRQPLDTLAHIVEASTGAIASAPAPARADLPPLYLESQLATSIYIRPIKAARRLIITFALPDVQPHYRSKPLLLISHLLGDEGPQSLLAYLKKQNWATSLSAGGGIHGSNFKDFNINLQLTLSGMQEVESILNAVFHYIALVREGVTDPWRHQERRRICQQMFDFSDPSKPLEECIHWSNQMFLFPYEHVVAGEYLLDRSEPEVLDALLDKLNPRNMRLKWIFPEAPVDQHAAWYDTPYGVEPLPDFVIDALMSPQAVDELSLPSQNPFIVDDTECIEPDEAYYTPSMVSESPYHAIWFAQDPLFRLPKGDCFLSFECPAVAKGPQTIALKRLLIACWVEQFNREFYQAGVAGLNFHLYPHQAGFSLHTSGFSQNQLDLCERLFKRLNAPFEQNRSFEQVKTKQLQALQNSLLNKPINRLFTRLSTIMQRYTYSSGDIIPHIEQASADHLRHIQQALLEDCFVEGLIHGDWQVDAARDFVQRCQERQKQNLSPQLQPRRVTRDVADFRGAKTILNRVDSSHDDAAIVIYLQSPGKTSVDEALTILAEQLLAGPFFNQLRTEKQLGYLVGTGFMPFNRHPGIAFYIQSPSMSAIQLYQEIENFLQSGISLMAQSAPQWNQIKASIIRQLDKNDTNMSMRSQRLWMAVGNQDLQLSYQQKLLEALSGASLEAVQDYFSALMSAQKSGKVVLYCPAKNETFDLSEASLIEDIHRFKRELTYSG